MLRTHLSVVGCGLVRVLPVTQPRDPLVSDSTTLGEAVGLSVGRFGLPFDPLTEPTRNRRVVLGGPPERRERQAAAGLLWDLSLAFQSRQHLFDDLLLGSAPGDGLFEGIEVDADQVYRADILLDELLYVIRVSEVG